MFLVGIWTGLVGVGGLTRSLSVFTLEGEIDRTGLKFLRFAMFASVTMLLARPVAGLLCVRVEGTTVTSDQLLTCFARWE